MGMGAEGADAGVPVPVTMRYCTSYCIKVKGRLCDTRFCFLSSHVYVWTP
jgi:hypothetical protein